MRRDHQSFVTRDEGAILTAPIAIYCDRSVHLNYRAQHARNDETKTKILSVRRALQNHKIYMAVWITTFQVV